MLLNAAGNAMDKDGVELLPDDEMAGIDPADEAADPADPAALAMMQELAEAAQFPEWAARRFEQIKDLRMYLEEDVYEHDNPQAVCVNALGRMLAAKTGQMWPERPMCSIKEQSAAGSAQDNPERAIHRKWAQTAGRLVNWYCDKSLLEDDIQAGLYDACVDGLTWLKTEWVEDQSRDPLGTPRMDDAQDQMARLKMLAEMAESGEINDSMSEWQELSDLVEYHLDLQEKLAARGDPRAQAMLPGLGMPPQPDLMPEALSWSGLEVSLCPLENVRLDWEHVTTLEQMHKGRWMIEIAWMTRDEIAQRYRLSDGERRKLGNRNGRGHSDKHPGVADEKGGSTSADAKEREAEDTEHGDMLAVYCCWHKQTRKRYTWCDGVDRWLDEQVWTGEFPFIPLALSKTPRRPIPISIGLGGLKLQQEINQTLTEAKAARRARYPRYAGKRGTVDPEDIYKITGAHPNAYIEVDEPEEIRKALLPIQGVEFDPRLYDVSGLFRLLEMETGVTMQQVGISTSGSTATEVERAQQGSATTAEMHSSLLRKALRKLYQLALAYIAEYVTPEQVAFILGPEDAAVWAAYPQGREQIAAGLKVDILASANGPSEMREQAESWMHTADALARVAQSKHMLAANGEALNTEIIYEAITEGMGLGVAGDELVQRMPMDPMQQAASEQAAGEAAGLAGQPG